MPEGTITSSHVSDGRATRRGISSLVTAGVEEGETLAIEMREDKCIAVIPGFSDKRTVQTSAVARTASHAEPTLGRLRLSGARGERPCRICLLIRAPNSIGAERDSVSGRGRGMEDSDGPPPDISLTD